MKIAVSTGKSLNFNAKFIHAVKRKRSKHRKTFGIKLLNVVNELKKT